MSRLPIARSNAPLCACGCGHRTSTIRTEYILGHRPPRAESERFWGHVQVGSPAECWPWVGYLYKNGYATFARTDGRKEMAHRVAYELSTGAPVPPEMTVDHLCRRRSCMNPSHMEVVTRGENAKRGRGWIASAATRAAAAEVACVHGHARAKYGRREPGTGAWRCRECRRLEARAHRQRKREARA